MLDEKRQKLVTDMLDKYPKPIAFAYAKLSGHVNFLVHAKGWEEEDINAELLVAITRAAERFDFDRGVKFSTLALKYCSKCILNLVQRTKTRGRTPIGNRLTFESDDLNTVLLSREKSNVINPDHLRHYMKKLDTRQQYILTLKYGLDGRGYRTLREIGLEYDLSRERIRQIIEDAFRKLRWHMGFKEVEAA